MADNINRFGLSRTIPAAVKHKVRQQSKFGCVVCRSAFYHYDHFDPEFKDATEHTASGICCLCPRCHQEVSSGRYSREYIKKCVNAVLQDADKPISPPLDFHDARECLKIGGLKYDLLPLTVVSYYGEEILSVKPKSDGKPGSISGRFYSDSGIEVLRIDENEIVFNTENWDIEVSGRSIKVRSGPRQVCLSLLIEPPGGISVEKLDMKFKDVHVLANRHVFCVGRSFNRENYLWFSAKIRILENRFRGSAIRIDDPTSLANEWNSLGATTVRPPIYQLDNNEGVLEFKTSGFPNIPFGFFSTAFLGNAHSATDSYAGLLHFASGVVIANRVGSFRVGASLHQTASLKKMRNLFAGDGPLSVNDLQKHLFPSANIKS